MAVLLAGAALTHPIARERRWLVAALVFSAAGDFLLAMPWWEPSFVLGLAAFLLAHLCFLAALLPLATRSAPRLAVRGGDLRGLCRTAGVVLAPADRRRDGGAGDCLHRRAGRHGVRRTAGPAADAVDRAGRGVLRGVGRDDRNRPASSCSPRHWQCRSGGRTRRHCCSSPPDSSSAGRSSDPLCYICGVSTRTRQAAEHEPIARVLPMLSVPHLDREFDYLVAAEQSDDTQPGVRVRVRFHGRLVDAFVLERRSETDHVGKLGWLDRVVSAEPVLTAEVRRLVDAVAARYAGTRADVLRLAVPPRHANVERETAAELAALEPKPVDTTAWAEYGRGEQYLSALARRPGSPGGLAGVAGGAVGRPARRGRRGHGELRPRRVGHRARPARRGRASRRRRSPRRRVAGGGAVRRSGPGTALPPLAGGAARRRAAGHRHPQRGVRARSRTWVW